MIFKYTQLQYYNGAVKADIKNMCTTAATLVDLQFHHFTLPIFGNNLPASVINTQSEDYSDSYVSTNLIYNLVALD